MAVKRLSERVVEVQGERRVVYAWMTSDERVAYSFDRTEVCDGCGGEGRVEFAGRTHSASTEPWYRLGECPDCRGLRTVEVEISCTEEGVEL